MQHYPLQAPYLYNLSKKRKGRCPRRHTSKEFSLTDAGRTRAVLRVLFKKHGEHVNAG
jgi:hypothetical protein